MFSNSKTESSKDATFNEDSINNYLMYDPEADYYYRISNRAKAAMSQSDYQKLLIIGHIKGGNLAALKWMFQSGYSLEVEDDSGLSLLMIATKHEYQNIVLWLLTLDVDLKRVNAEGENAYQFALKMGRKEIANQIAKASLRNFEKQLNLEPLASQIKKSQKTQEILAIANRTFSGDNPYYSKFVVKENHKMLMIMVTLLEDGNEELNITANLKQACELFDGLIADDCLYAMIMKVELLLGNVQNSDTYFDLHPNLKDKDQKEKEIISLLSKISKLGDSYIVYRICKTNKEMLSTVAKDFINRSNLTSLSLTRTMSVDSNLNKKFKVEGEQRANFKLRNTI